MSPSPGLFYLKRFFVGNYTWREAYLRPDEQLSEWPPERISYRGAVIFFASLFFRRHKRGRHTRASLRIIRCTHEYIYTHIFEERNGIKTRRARRGGGETHSCARLPIVFVGSGNVYKTLAGRPHSFARRRLRFTVFFPRHSP